MELFSIMSWMFLSIGFLFLWMCRHIHLLPEPGVRQHFRDQMKETGLPVDSWWKTYRHQELSYSRNVSYQLQHPVDEVNRMQNESDVQRGPLFVRRNSRDYRSLHHNRHLVASYASGTQTDDLPHQGLPSRNNQSHSLVSAPATVPGDDIDSETSLKEAITAENLDTEQED